MICCIITFSLRTAYETRWYGCFGRSKWIPAARGYGKSGMLCTSLHCLSWFCSSWCSLKFSLIGIVAPWIETGHTRSNSFVFTRYYLLSILCIRSLYNPTQHINWVLIQGAPGAQPITLKSSTPLMSKHTYSGTRVKRKTKSLTWLKITTTQRVSLANMPVLGRITTVVLTLGHCHAHWFCSAGSRVPLDDRVHRQQTIVNILQYVLFYIFLHKIAPVLVVPHMITA